MTPSARLDGQVRAVRFRDGWRRSCDAVLVGVGAQPNQALALRSGLARADGVVVDGEARTSDARIFAIGDVSRRPSALYDRSVRLESVPNALEQAKQAAAAIIGRAPPAAEAPWFWSDQYDLKLQIASLALDADSMVVRGDPGTGRFALFHLKAGVIQAVEAVNAAPAFMAEKAMIPSRSTVDAVRLADTSLSMKDMAA